MRSAACYEGSAFARAERNKGLTSTFQSVDRRTCSMLRRPMVVSVAVMAHSWSIASSWDAMMRWK